MGGGGQDGRPRSATLPDGAKVDDRDLERLVVAVLNLVGFLVREVVQALVFRLA
jgi:hypothetical protein